MASKSSDWRPGPTVCRCCLAEGCYKDISTEYFWMGKREVYAEMLLDALNLSIAYSQSGGPNSNSRLICELCITRLREASEFKRQVQECEKTFMQCLDPGAPNMTELDVTLENIDNSEVKVERVKLEKPVSDDDDFDDRPDFGDDDDDDLDDQPLTKFASKEPKKESVDILDLLDNSKAGVKRKSTSKTKTTPAKKVKLKEKPKKETVKPTTSKSKAPKPTIKLEKKKKDETPYYLVRENAELIIKHTTAYPFRVNSKFFRCVYCGDIITDPDEFREHMATEHQKFNLAMVFVKLPKTEPVKADVKELKCRICNSSIANLKNAAEHLLNHNVSVRLDIDIGIMPYKLEKDSWKCAVCDKYLPSLLHLNKHTISHFQNHSCEVCGKSYKAATDLVQHIRAKHDLTNKAYCRRCRKDFPSMEAKTLHMKTEKRCMMHCCIECTERFPSWEMKQKHMVEAHGMEKKTYRCTNCDWVCEDRRAFYDHFKLRHSQDCLLCIHCGLKFATLSKLNRHIEKHASKHDLG